MSDTSLYFRLPPYPHQEKVWLESRDLKGFAAWWEMGVGKSCLTIGTFSWLYRQGKVDTLVVVAPNGVHANWTLDEIPAHLPDDLQVSARMMTWFSAKAGNKGTQAEFDALVKYEGPVVFVMSYDAVMTDKGSRALKRLLEKRECLYVLDESGRIKTPGSKRTKRILASSRYAKWKRVLTGTPVDNSPFDVYTQVKFIRPDILAEYGVQNFGSFKVRYGIWEKRMNRAQGRQFDQLVRYIRLDELHEIVDSVGSRLLKTDVLDLPESIYEKRYFDLDGPQRKAYKDLEKNFVTWLEGEGSSATADLILVRMTRMLQLSSGFVKDDDDRVVAVGKNVRLRALQDVLEDVSGSVLIFTRWTWELDQVRAWLGEGDAVYVDGRTPDQDRITARKKFQAGEVRFFVAKQQAVSEGYTLHRAKTVIYLSNTWSLRERLQSEARAHRAGMSNEPVTYIDILARDTYDEKLIKTLRGKRSTAALVTGDFLTDWA